MRTMRLDMNTRLDKVDERMEQLEDRINEIDSHQRQ